MSNKKCKILEDINDILIVRKITETDPASETANKASEARECLCFRTICDCEKNLRIEEQEAVIRKQLQMLQADERGKQALISEIAALKQSQEQKIEWLKNRQRARDIENDRARKIASLPPPLPKSVKSLLKKHYDEPKTSKPDVQMPDELQAVKIKPGEPNKENKENILDPEELEARQKMQEEWQMKAKKRFNEALKKDRQKEAYSNIMKQIENAELYNRREMAKNISSDKKGIPCPLSDKFQISKNQADMEEAAEKLFKKISNKEHVIEDVEGYHDRYEDNYKRIDSNYESKMIDCIPNFIKENYEYLLEDDSKFEGGRNFLELNNSSSDILNQAYIESPPGTDEIDGREKIDLAISHLDKLRIDLQTEYEQTVKPLLVAAIEVPKKLSSDKADKAVETESIKLSKDKAVETDMQFKEVLTSPPTLPPFDFKSAGVMAYKRRQRGPILSSYREMIIPNMRHRDVCYPVPSPVHSEDLATGSWSSSSYCSIPSKHGIPTFSNETESVKCDICVAEMKDDFVKEVPHSSALYGFTKKPDKSTISTEKVPLSEYVQQLAKKYSLAKSSKPSGTVREDTKVETDSVFPVHSKVENVSPAFEKETVWKPKAGLFVEQQKSEEFISTSVTKNDIEETLPKSLPSSVEKANLVTKEKMIYPDAYLKEDIHNKIKNYELSEAPVEYSDYDLELKRIQGIQQDLSRRIPHFTLDLSPKPTENTDLNEETESPALSAQNRMIAKPHVYHELSTIQELDSALTAGSLHLSHSKLSDTSDIKVEKKPPLQQKSKENSGLSTERLQIVSLLDPPDSEISELAKSIQFVEAQEKEVTPLKISKSISSECLNVMSVSSKEDLSAPSCVTPSDFPTDSGSSVSSTAKVFSSTLSGNHNQPFLKDIKILPLYFKDISDIQQATPVSEKSSSSVPLPDSIFQSSSSESNGNFKPMTPHSDISTPKESAVLTPNYELASVATSSGSFKPLTPHSEVSTPKELDVRTPKYDYASFASSSGSFKPLTPHSDISSNKECQTVLAPKYEHADFVTSTGSFKALTPHSDISSPKELGFPTPNYKHTGFTSSAGSFKTLTPHSDISSVATPKYKQTGFGTSMESFKALTPHSNISSPSELSPKYGVFTSNTESFKTLTPHSNISSPMESAASTPNYELQTLNPKSAKTTPSFFYDESELQRNNFSSNSEFHPLTIRLDFSTSSISSNNNNQVSELSKLTQLSCHLGVKTHILSSSNYVRPSKVPEQKQIAVSTNKDIFRNKSNNSLEISEKEFEKIKDKKSVHPCPSGSFTPHSSYSPNSKTENTECELVEGTLTTDWDESNAKTNFVPQKAVVSDSENKQNLLETKESDTVSVSSSEVILGKNMKGKPLFEKSEESDKNQNLQSLEMGKAVKKHYSNLQAISSTSSSTENLSEISESKVLHQSTPIKNIPETVKEQDIMKRPDLTPLNTMLSCKMDSPVKKSPSVTTASPVECFISSDNDNTITPSQDEKRTPDSQNPRLLDCADSPSMLSFLHHEMSCMQTEDVGAVGKSQFRRNEYKQRTKRLWNNLEEVRKKNENEEKKKLMVINRLKAKEFAKKLTPKKK